jgi:hypothetical protein
MQLEVQLAMWTESLRLGPSDEVGTETAFPDMVRRIS